MLLQLSISSEEDFGMPIFLQISRHSPENCPAFNEKAKEASMNALGKMDELMKKHGVKMLGYWVAPREHTGYMVVEAPNFGALQKLSMEPEMDAMRAFNTTEVKPVIKLEETLVMQEYMK